MGGRAKVRMVEDVEESDDGQSRKYGLGGTPGKTTGRP